MDSELIKAIAIIMLIAVATSAFGNIPEQDQPDTLATAATSSAPLMAEAVWAPWISHAPMISLRPQVRPERLCLAPCRSLRPKARPNMRP